MLLPDGKTGMVHISEVSNEYVQELSDVLSEGQTVKVKVMNVSDDGKIALSIKRTPVSYTHLSSFPLWKSSRPKTCAKC